MSRNINLSSNNLCTTEDAFEQFQAVAMYEEDEFITLSDIVPPQPVVPDLSNELNEIPYDNEVVLSSANDDGATLATNNTVESSQHQNNEPEMQIHDISKANAHSEHSTRAESYHSEGRPRTNGKLKKKQKLGRRKVESNENITCQNQSHNLNKFLETENNASIDNQAVQDNFLSTTIGKNRTETKGDSKEESKYPRRTRRERIPNTSKYPLISETSHHDTTTTKSTPGKRRGRPKKSLIENSTISEPDSTNVDMTLIAHENVSYTESSEPDDSSRKSSVRKGRRGRPKMVPSQIEIEQIIPIDSSMNISDSGNINAPSKDVKKSTRRGRKRISETIEKLADSIEDSQEPKRNDLPETLSFLHNENKSSLNESAEENVHIHDDESKSDKQIKKKGAVTQHTDEHIENVTEDSLKPINLELDSDDDADDICLSKLKENVQNKTETLVDNVTANIQNSTTENDETSARRNSKTPYMADFEYNIDKIVKEASLDGQLKTEINLNDSLLVEDTSKRSNRRKTKQNFKYDEGSDEDPFADMESSDEDEPRTRKKSRYHSDDEYIPGKKKGMIPVTSSESEVDEDLEEGKKQKRKKIFKNVENQSPRKRGRKRTQATSLNEPQEGDIEAHLEPALIKPEDEPLSMKPPAEAWATSNEFENFIAQKIQGSSLKIKKISSKQKTDSIVPPIEIPVLDQNEPKKMIEISTQTTRTSTTSTGMQTCVPYDVPMKTNLTLTSQQSEKACEFLNSVVKTTVELGQLMKEKSEDFMKKKINAENVTDTFKMDYCVRKSFLLFKLAKHNLMQMEEDLAKQYDEFLKSNNLSSCREQLRNVTAKPKAESDSDCEIVDVKEVSVTKEKPKFNPKTVFLNKELSIKIAKKPTDKNTEGRHTVWINDSVMVKKVKPTQSFLAQDSRNKKPPDCITEKMVSDFFKDYYRQKAISVCAPYINTEFSSVCKEYACYYFVKCNDFDESNAENIAISMNVIENDSSTSIGNCDIADTKEPCKNNPKSLSFLCAEVVRNHMYADHIKEASEVLPCNLKNEKNENHPLSLFRLCIQSLTSVQDNATSDKPSILKNMIDKTNPVTVLPLKSLCYRKVVDLMSLFKELSNNEYKNELASCSDNYYDNSSIDDNMETSVCQDVLFEESNICDYAHLHSNSNYWFPDDDPISSSSINMNNMKSLFLLCVQSIQTIFGNPNKFIGKKIYPLIQVENINPTTSSPKSLKCIVYENIKHYMYDDQLTDCYNVEPGCHSDGIFHSYEEAEDFTINCINTMSEEAFHSLAPNEYQNNDVYDYEPDIDDFDVDNEVEENEWASQVQMQEPRSCITPTNNISVCEYDGTSLDNDCVRNEFDSTNIENDDQYQNNLESTLNNIMTSQIKLEPLEDVSEHVDSSIVKIEPVHVLDGMTIIPESFITKSELIESNTGIEADDLLDKESSTYDVNTFEQFVKANKMMQLMDKDSDSEEIFSQSALRIRRQHEPDYDAENDLNESLLVPQTYEPLHIVNAKGVLMESSSEESKDSLSKKTGKKKSDRKKGKQKKGKEITKNSNVKEVTTTVVKETPTPIKEKVQNINEVAILTRRMREKIRQEEKKIESSDSETDNVSLILRKDKNKLKNNEKNKVTKNLKQGETSTDNKEVEIQCNNVDSTEQISENGGKSKGDVDQFTGFSAIDQNDISSYQKYMKYVYDKLIPGDEDSSSSIQDNFDGASQDSNMSSFPVINPDHPVELLECEPTMPIFDNENIDKVKKPKKIVNKKQENKLRKGESKPEKDEPKFRECDGWHLYNMDTFDGKLYQSCQIPLEKLPESFVETYLAYHDITDRDNIDKEVDRLVNLQSLNRASIKEGKIQNRLKGKSSSNELSASEQNSENVSRGPSRANSDRYDELTPSEDEGTNLDDELAPPVPMRTTENCIAKNSLMDENESESDGGGTKKIKEELTDTNQVEEKYKPGPKSRTKIRKAKEDIVPSSQSLMLTADKMMNKELSLLHAPIVLKQELETSPKKPSPKDETKSKKRNLRNIALRDRFKTEDDSSSEEEKQWVSTKEKLLKRMGKKEDATADDAKRAKLVVDFIERRGEGSGRRVLPRLGSRRSRKKFLERMKQQRVLSKELYGETSLDLTPGGKRGAAPGLFKGRRNIRKVIDKKSLHKSTVLANMEEFERKRRLNARQNQLRELLGCEEGVNVLVINDEVCLEYDFEEQRPVVTVHPFFTKVMKAHQYEGVKFMWDACFESLASIEAGRGGGGCILAHCMGLGKTLQVLALLHTVLTHPRAGMHRVLVCCPLSTVLNWVDEIHKWIGPVTDQIKVFELSKLKKTYERAYQLEDWYNGGGIFIIGYELFRSLTTLDPMIDEVRPTIINKIRTALLDPGPDIIICDEGHLLKNDCSVLAVAMSRVVTKRRIILTGTPMQNNLREYYCMVNFVKPNLLGTYSEYSNRFENPIMNGQHRDSREEDIKLMKARTHILHKVLEGCLQRQEASVLYPYLPKKHEYTVFIPLTKCQWDLYKHYVHHYTKKSKQSILRDFHILQKIWSHPQVLHNFQIKSREDTKKKEIKTEKLEDDLALEDKEDIKPTDTEVWWLQYLADGAMLNSIDSSNKFVAVFRILHECIALGDKVLIFSTSLFCLDALEYFLREINSWSLGQEYYRLDGSVPAEVRQKWVREFNAENNVKTKLFLISTRAGCLGLNMTAANRVIILDTSWNPAHDIQSIFRVYRFGQKKDCYIYRLVAMGTMEQKIYERSVTKQAVACRVVDEQQIDRHYNMAELTELYRFDEFGSGVAGGVAVGVGDVALLRVARDAAVHAVHEHDSLLRGSGEQGLPEHERAAAWMQFQQEHAHKQMQNDLETDQAAQALKKLQDEQEQLIQQQIIQQQAQVLNIKTENEPVHESVLKQTLEQPVTRSRGSVRGRGRKANVVQCRIPIKLDSEQPGPSRSSPMGEEEMVRQISDLLVKHNFTQTGKGPKQIKELVAKVKQMVQTGQPMSFAGSDELTASIASVLLQQKGEPSAPSFAPPPMPPLTDIDIEPRRNRGRPKKPVIQDEPPPIVPTTTKPKQPEAELEVGGRRRRKAALAAERQFDMIDDTTSQDSLLPDPVIELNDDDWQGAPSDTDSATEFDHNSTHAPIEQKPDLKKDKDPKRMAIQTVPKKSDKQKEDASILLSDDETPPVEQPVPSPEEPIYPLHPSLLTNQNFIKIVAHTYLAGNPMLDEDAATLAAQYSTFRLLKETESSGKPIESGPIYDIAIKVLGKDVLKKLHIADPKSKKRGVSSATSSKLKQILGQNAATEASAAPVKKRPGPKSRVQPVIEEPKETPRIAVPTTAHMQQTSTRIHQNSTGIVPITLVRRAPASAPAPLPAAAPAPADECILPDDDEVHCVTEQPAPPQTKPLKYNQKLIPVKKESDAKPKKALRPSELPVLRVTSGAVAPGPATNYKTYSTICLDSDEDEPSPVLAPNLAPVLARTRQAQTQQYSMSEGPVPVALTGPNSQPLPLHLGPSPTPAPQPSPVPQPTYYKYANDPVPVSLTGPNSGPVPISLTGPDNMPVPISLTGPGFQAIPIPMGGQVPLSLAGSVPMSVGAPSIQMSLVSGAQSIPVTLTVPPVRPGAPAPETGGVLLVPAERVLTRVSPAQVPPALRVHSLSAAAPGAAHAVKAGDLLRLNRNGQLEAVQSSYETIHTIDDDEPETGLIQQAATPKMTVTKTPTQLPKATTPAPKAATLVPKAPQPTPIGATPATKPPTPTPNPQQSTLASLGFKSRNENRERRQRKISSSSSSSSDSSRSPSPDPLSILKDVIHIQAPGKRVTKSTPPAPNKTETPAPKQPSTSNQIKTTPIQISSSNDKDIRKDNVIGQKVKDILTAVKAKKNLASNIGNIGIITLGKSQNLKAINSKAALANIKDSIDLTNVTFKPAKPGDSSQNNLKGGKLMNIPKKEGPSTVVGTSKNIVLDGKSKSLTNKSMVDLTGQKSVQVTNVKTIPPAAASKQKPTEKKRPAPPTDTAAPKKKKTELMTLKDFDIDIDDIDDIIELD